MFTVLKAAKGADKILICIVPTADKNKKPFFSNCEEKKKRLLTHFWNRLKFDVFYNLFSSHVSRFF